MEAAGIPQASGRSDAHDTLSVDVRNDETAAVRMSSDVRYRLELPVIAWISYGAHRVGCVSSIGNVIRVVVLTVRVPAAPATPTVDSARTTKPASTANIRRIASSLLLRIDRLGSGGEKPAIVIGHGKRADGLGICLGAYRPVRLFQPSYHSFPERHQSGI
jgi:hypothetical protein